MAYDEGLAQRIREEIESVPGIAEKEMFGGICFLVRGNMAVGVIGDDLIVRVGPDDHTEALARPHVRPFDFTGRPMKGWVVVAGVGLASDTTLARWLDRGIRFASGLPAKGRG